jgi:hypothetical protein
MSFADVITFQFKDPDGGVKLTAKYNVYPLMKHSKTLRDIFIYQHPDPINDTLSTDQLDSCYREVRNPSVIKLVFDYLMHVAEIEKGETKRQKGNVRRVHADPEWALRLFDSYSEKFMKPSNKVFDGMIGIGGFELAMVLYFTMLELQMDADKDVKLLPATVRSRTLAELHTHVPSAKDFHLAWILFGAEDPKFAKAVLNRTLTCMIAAADTADTAVPSEVSGEPQKAAGAEGENMITDASESQPQPAPSSLPSDLKEYIDVTTKYELLGSTFAEALMNRCLSLPLQLFRPAEPVALKGWIENLFVLSKDWKSILERTRALCATKEQEVRKREEAMKHEEEKNKKNTTPAGKVRSSPLWRK